MLLNFAVTNYRSIKERQVFSMMAVDGLPHKKTLIHSKDGASILPVALLFGANASGKSNVLRAFGMMRYMVKNSVRLNPDDPLDDYDPFRLDKESRNNNTEVEIEFIIHEGKDKEQHYLYGFAFTEEKIAEEWLYQQGENTNKVKLFVRNGVDIQIDEEVFPEGKDKEGTLASNRLFLSLIAQLNGEKSKGIIEWFKKSSFASALHTEQYMTLTSRILKSQKEKEKEKMVYKKYAQMALTFLRNIDMRIKDLSITEEQVKNLPKDMPEVLKEFLSDKEGKFIRVESKHDVYNKNGESIDEEVFNVRQHESEGTQKIIELLGFIFTILGEGRLFIIDELDAKLHPLLTRAIIQLFTDRKINRHGAQLIFTTHDTNQLNLDYVRRDEIWFTEKSCVETTELYSHIEFKEFDPSMDITEQYVDGRYGAIPRIKMQR